MGCIGEAGGRSGAKELGLFLGRIVLAAHFLFELGDKIFRWSLWARVIGERGLPLPQAELALIVVLLSWGSISVLSGKRLLSGFLCLLLFQVPTSIAFEDSMYERFDSLSSLGGVLCLLLYSSQTGAKYESEDEGLSKRLVDDAKDGELVYHP